MADKLFAASSAEMLHPLEESSLICKYICTRVYCAKTIRDTVSSLAFKRLSCRALPLSSSSVTFSRTGSVQNALLRAPPWCPPGPADL